VREREREREREKAVWNVLHSIHLNINEATITANLLVLCVTSKREKEYCSDR